SRPSRTSRRNVDLARRSAARAPARVKTSLGWMVSSGPGRSATGAAAVALEGTLRGTVGTSVPFAFRPVLAPPVVDGKGGAQALDVLRRPFELARAILLRQRIDLSGAEHAGDAEHGLAEEFGNLAGLEVALAGRGRSGRAHGGLPEWGGPEAPR